MNKYTNVLLSFIIVLLLLNLWLTSSVLVKQAAQLDVAGDRVENLGSSVAKVLGKKVTRMYNQQDHQALYALFSAQAKVKITHQQLQSQLEKLFELFGEIEESAFVSAEKIGEKNGDIYYKLLFDIRVKEANKRQATLTISVVKRGNKVNLFGVRINATHSLD